MIKDISVLDTENKEWEALGGRIRRENPYWAGARGEVTRIPVENTSFASVYSVIHV
jgi:hypothetical protein